MESCPVNQQKKGSLQRAHPHGCRWSRAASAHIPRQPGILHFCFKSRIIRIEGLIAQHLLRLIDVNADRHHGGFPPSPLRAEVCLRTSRVDVTPEIYKHGLNCLKIFSRLCWETKDSCAQKNPKLCK